MSFTDVEYQEVDKFQRTDLAPYRTVFDGLKDGVQATIVVPTGELNDKGRGKTELGHERAFRMVASERGVGLRVGHTHMPDGKTRLRLLVAEKRVFSPEALKKRQEALEKSRKEKAAAKAAAEKAAKEAESKESHPSNVPPAKAAAPVHKAS